LSSSVRNEAGMWWKAFTAIGTKQTPRPFFRFLKETFLKHK